MSQREVIRFIGGDNPQVGRTFTNKVAVHVPDALADYVVIGHNVTIAAYDKSRTVYIDELFWRGRGASERVLRTSWWCTTGE